MSQFVPIEVLQRVWLGMFAFVLCAWIPGISLAAAAYLGSGGLAGTGTGPAMALLVAALGTTVQTWNEMRGFLSRMARSPDRREPIHREAQSASLVWGLMCVAAWLGFFSQLYG